MDILRKNSAPVAVTPENLSPRIILCYYFILPLGFKSDFKTPAITLMLIIDGEIKYGNGFDIYTKEDIPLCSECYDKEKNTPKKELKRKVILGILILIACGTLILAIGSIIGIL